MSLRVARVLRPQSLDELGEDQRARLVVAAQMLWGEELEPEDAWAYDDFGADCRIWVFEEDGVPRYELWDGTGGMDGAVVDLSGPGDAGAGLVQHGLTRTTMDAARFAELEAAWEGRAAATADEQAE